MFAVNKLITSLLDVSSNCVIESDQNNKLAFGFARTDLWNSMWAADEKRTEILTDVT